MTSSNKQKAQFLRTRDKIDTLKRSVWLLSDSFNNLGKEAVSGHEDGSLGQSFHDAYREVDTLTSTVDRALREVAAMATEYYQMNLPPETPAAKHPLSS